MAEQGTKRRAATRPPRQAARGDGGRPLKEETLIVKVTPDLKASINQKANEADETMSNWVRKVLSKVVRGWRLVPPEEV